MRTSTIARGTAVVLAAIAASSCTGPQERAEEPGITVTTTIATDCFRTSLARDFRYLDDRNLIVFAPRGVPYHVQLMGPCFGLRRQIAIGISSRSDRICGFAGDAILVDGPMIERCPVLGVTRLDDEGLRALIEQFEPDGAPEGAVEVEIPAAEDAEETQ